MRLATATCSKFPWVSDLPFTPETASLLKRCAVDEFGLADGKTDAWSNGSSEEFLGWLKQIGEKGDPDSTLILFLATHQWGDGRTKFSSGSDLAPEKLIRAINEAAARYQRILFINDGCYASGLEKRGSFSDKVIRLYASGNDHPALDVNFDKGPYGLEEFAQKERLFLRSRMQWNPKGMSFLGLIGLKAALSPREKSAASLDLQTFMREMNRCRDLYNETVRQAKAQRLALAPSDANFVILKRSGSL